MLTLPLLAWVVQIIELEMVEWVKEKIEQMQQSNAFSMTVAD